MTDRDFDADAWQAAMAPLMGLTIEPAWREEVSRQLALLARAAALCAGGPEAALKEEPAPVFTPAPPA